MATADELLDAPSADDLLGAEPSKLSPTGLAPLVNAGLNAIPGFGAAKQVMEARPLRKFVGEGSGMAAGAAVATAGGQPELAPIGAGVGNVVGGELSDIQDNPDRAKDAFNFLFNPTTPTISQQLAQSYQKDPDGTTQKVKQELSKAGERFTSGAVSQLLTMGVSKFLGAAASVIPGAGSAIPGAKELLDAQGLKTDPSMYTTGKFANVLKGMAQEGLLSADDMTAINETNKGILNERGKDLITEMAGRTVENIPPSELAQMITQPKAALGEPLQKEIERRMFNNPELNGVLERVPVDTPADTGLVNAEGKPIMKNVQDYEYQRTGGVNIPVAKFKNLAQEHLAVSELGNSVMNPESVNTLLKKINGLDDTVNFATAHDIRSELLSLSRDADSPNAKRILNDLVHNDSYGLESLMEDSANSLKKGNPEAYQKYLDAKEFYKAGKQTFNNDLIAKMFVSDETLPEKVGRSIFTGGNTTQVQQLKSVFQRVQDLTDNPENAAELQKVLSNNPEAAELIQNGQYKYDSLMNKVRGGTLQTLFGRYTYEDAKSLSGTRVNYDGILNDLSPTKNPEEYATLKEMFPEEQIGKLRDWAKAGSLAVQTNPDAYGRAMFWVGRIVRAGIGGTIGGAIGHATGFPAAGALAGATAEAFGEGKLASYLLTDPQASKLFTQGVSALADTKTAKTGSDLMIKAAKTWVDNNATPQEQK